MAVITAKFTGGDVLAKALRTLPVKVEKQIIREATKAAAEPVLHAARSHAPVLTGDLVASLKITTKTSSKKSSFTARVQAAGQGAKTGNDYTGDQFYAAFQEFGTSHQPARPFMRPAFDENVDKAIGIMATLVKSGLEREGAMK